MATPSDVVSQSLHVNCLSLQLWEVSADSTGLAAICNGGLGSSNEPCIEGKGMHNSVMGSTFVYWGSQSWCTFPAEVGEACYSKQKSHQPLPSHVRTQMDLITL